MNHEQHNIHFQEEQRFDQWWMRVLFAIPVIGAIVAIVEEGISLAMLPAIGIVVLLAGLLFSLKLVTEVRDDGIYIRFYPFHWQYKRFAFADIRTAQSRTYRPILEYGGWGIRYGRDGMAYNVSGTEGLQLVLKNKKRILIGSQRMLEFEQVVKTITHQ